jgi:hypothetical protein
MSRFKGKIIEVGKGVFVVRGGPRCIGWLWLKQRWHPVKMRLFMPHFPVGLFLSLTFSL